MDTSDCSSAKDAAAYVTKNYKLGIPVNMDRVISGLGAELRYLNMPKEAEGLVLKNRNELVIIVNSALQHNKRGRLVLAHELAHVFLGLKKPMGIAFSMKSSKKHNPNVNVFALSLLMPERHFKAMIKNRSSLKDLANMYDVRICDVKERLTYL